MKNEINAVLENMTATTPEPEDYTGEDGLLYCGKCRKPKEAYFAPDKAAIFGRDRHPAECDCQRAAREEREAAEKRRRHLDTVEELKRRAVVLVFARVCHALLLFLFVVIFLYLLLLDEEGLVEGYLDGEAVSCLDLMDHVFLGQLVQRFPRRV